MCTLSNDSDWKQLQDFSSSTCTRQSELQGQTELLRALSSWILENLKDEDSITGLGSILLPSLSLSSLSFQKQEPYLSG